MIPIPLGVFTGSMEKNYCVSIKNPRVDLSNGTRSRMLNNGCCMLIIWAVICGPPPRSIDETSLSDGELYTILTNKAAKGKNGSIIAIIAGTKAETVIEILRKIPLRMRKKVSEITLDMAGNMALIAKRCFPSATQVTDRFHVQKLASEALQEIRIKYRWQAIEAENEAIEQAKATQAEYQPEVLSNGDTVKQLLARSRYVLYKKEKDWTETQKQRATLLFERYADLKKAYELTMALSHIFEHTTDKLYGLARLAKWHDRIAEAKGAAIRL